MKVYYGGNMIGYHTVGKRGVKLVPGPNSVSYELGMALIDAGVVTEIEEKKTEAPTISQQPFEIIEDAADESDDEAGEGV